MSASPASPRLLPQLQSRFAVPTLLEAAAIAVAGAAIGLLAVYSTHALVEGLLAIALVVVALRWPVWATVAFVFISFPVILPSWLGVGATVSKPFGLVLVSAWVLLILREPSRPLLMRDRPGVTALLGGYLVWACLSYLWTIDSSKTVYQLERLLPVIVLTFVVYTTAATRRELAILTYGYVVTSGIWSAYALLSGTAVEGDRLTGGLNDPNYFASELVLATILGGYLLMSTSSAKARVGLIACIGFNLVAFLLTQSRGGVVGMGVGVLAAIAVAGRRRGAVVATVTLALAVSVLYLGLLSPAGVAHRLTDLSSSQSSGRTDSWTIAYDVFRANPFVGVGLGAFQVAQLSYVSSVNLQFPQQILDQQLVSHNTYLDTLSELGLIGMLFLGGGIALVFRGAFSAMTQAEDEEDTYVLRGLVAGTVGLLTSFVFLSAEAEKSLWIALALIAAASRLVVPPRENDAARPT